jgi:hypothetical protein
MTEGDGDPMLLANSIANDGQCCPVATMGHLIRLTVPP